MAGISTADDTTETLDTLRARWRYTLARLKSDPNGAPYVADFVAFGATWDAADKKERDLEDAVTDGQAAAVKADADLDALVRKVSAAIFGGKKIDITLPLAQLFFGGLSPSDFMRPTLGKQLAGMTAWPGLLVQSTQPGLLALAPPAAVVVPAATEAATTLGAAIVARDLFDQGGERAAVFAAFNALCATAHGGLGTFAHNHPELDLPPGYAESFFQQSSTASQPKTLTAASALVARLQQKLGRAQAVQAALAQKEAARAAQEQEHQKALEDEATAKKAEDAAKKARKEAEVRARKTKPKK